MRVVLWRVALVQNSVCRVHHSVLWHKHDDTRASETRGRETRATSVHLGLKNTNLCAVYVRVGQFQSFYVCIP